jgi:hypothetical protein
MLQVARKSYILELQHNSVLACVYIAYLDDCGTWLMYVTYMADVIHARASRTRRTWRIWLTYVTYVTDVREVHDVRGVHT